MSVTLKTDVIQFPATQVPSADANALDDYEEGTWTPIDSSGAALTFTSTAGFYEKIGRQVTARCTLTFPSTASGSNAVIGGLPFTIPNVAGVAGGFVSYTTESTLVRTHPAPNTTTVPLYNNVGVAVTNATMSLDSLYFTVIYYV